MISDEQNSFEGKGHTAVLRSFSQLFFFLCPTHWYRYIGIDGTFHPERPGNGGMRILNYSDCRSAADEAAVLATTMTAKHAVYNTGFGGAKLVMNAVDDVSELDKIQLLEEIGVILNDLGGTVVTGCDLNTSSHDMATLMQHTEHVLASVNCPSDPNAATAHGVYAATVTAAEEILGGIVGRTVLVKGCGKVGGALARLLLAAGAIVLTYDIFPEAADIKGCINVSCEPEHWIDVECDIFCPCSTTGFIDTDTAQKLKATIVAGSCNSPFATPQALEALESRGAVYIHEGISSAGAVLCDSIERFDSHAYRTSHPMEVYGFIQQLVSTKTKDLLAVARKERISATQALPFVVDKLSLSDESVPVGALFSSWLESVTEEVDVAIIGGGMAGTSTAYWLSQQEPAAKGLVLEAVEVAHKGGSSYGDSRMFREMYSDPYFSKMQRESLKLWKEIESNTNTTLLTHNGLLFYGQETEETVEGSVQGARNTMVELGIEHEYFENGEALRSRWPNLSAQHEEQGVYEATAGSIHSSNACKTMMDAALESGNWQLRQGVRVMGISRMEGCVQLFTSDGKKIKAKKVVVAAGAWTNEVLQHLNLKLDIEVWNVAWGHYEVSREAADQVPQWFHFEPEAETQLGVDGRSRHPWDGGLIYGFPPQKSTSQSTGDEVLKAKVGIDFTPETDSFRTQDMNSFHYEAHPDVCQIVDDFLAHAWVPGTFGKRLDFVCSPYSMTNDNYFVLDSLPGIPEVCVFTGGCGRAFKFAPLLGKCLSELVLDKEPSWDITPFQITRPAVNLSSLVAQELTVPI